jgi:hypothetical protein
MRRDLWDVAQKAAAEQYGREHRFYVLVGHKLVLPGVVVGAVVLGYLALPEGAVGSVLADLAPFVGIAVMIVVLVVMVVASRRSPGVRLPNGRRPPKLPRNM